MDDVLVVNVFLFGKLLLAVDPFSGEYWHWWFGLVFSPWLPWDVLVGVLCGGHSLLQIDSAVTALSPAHPTFPTIPLRVATRRDSNAILRRIPAKSTQALFAVSGATS